MWKYFESVISFKTFFFFSLISCGKWSVIAKAEWWTCANKNKKLKHSGIVTTYIWKIVYDNSLALPRMTHRITAMKFVIFVTVHLLKNTTKLFYFSLLIVHRGIVSLHRKSNILPFRSQIIFIRTHFSSLETFRHKSDAVVRSHILKSTWQRMRSFSFSSFVFSSFLWKIE